MRMSVGGSVSFGGGAAGQKAKTKTRTDAVLVTLDAVEALVRRGDSIDELLGVEVPAVTASAYLRLGEREVTG